MERIKLNLIPSGVAPIVHLSQYDDGRQFGIDLFEGESVYVLDGTETLTVNSRKPDGHVVTLTVTNTGTSSLDVDTVEQLTAVHGVSYAKLKIEKGSVTIATLPFLIDVSRDPLENGDPSESFIQNLETQVSEMVAEDVAEQYDSANVIFDNAPTSGHGTPYTVTSEGIKTAIDNAFDYDNTASGSLVHIEDGADNIPVKSLVSQIVAVESGNGQPKSPSNPYTISGFANGVVSVCGKNLLENEATSGTVGTITFTVNADKSITVNGSTTTQRVFLVHTNFSFNADLILSGIPSGSGLFLNVAGLGSDTGNGFTFNGSTARNIQIVVPANSTINNVTVYPMVRLASVTDSTYEKYNGNTYTFTFGQTVYGGHFDNKGNLVVTHQFVDLGSLTYGMGSGGNARFTTQLPLAPVPPSSASAIADIISDIYTTTSSSDIYGGSGNYLVAIHTNGLLWIRNTDYSDVNTFKTAMSGHCVVYELANPITLSITSQDIPTLLGENNIFSNCGDVEVTYYTNKANDILEFVDSEIGKKNGTNIPIEANSQDSIKTYVDDEISSTKDYVDNGLNDKVAYKSGEVVYSNYVTGAYVSGSGNYVEFCIPINTKATSGTIANLGTTLNVFIGNTRLTNEVSLTDSSIVAIKDGFAQVELKLNSTQTANSVATVSLDGFTVNFA